MFGSGFRMFVFETVRSINRLCQIIITSNNSRKVIFFRLSIEGSFEGTEWASFVPSNIYELTGQDFINEIDLLRSQFNFRTN
jgi:hypothetical protein